jgi:hypothetical protein
MSEIVGEYIDRAVTIEMRFAAGLPRGVTHKLYDAARAHHKVPLTFLAAKSLLERVHTGDHVLVITGAGAWPWLPNGETDGPLGAAAIARALEIGIGAKPIIIAEERNMRSTIAAVEAAGLVIGDQRLFEARGGAALASAFPLGAEAGRIEAARLIEEFKPTAMVFIEKGGPNQLGQFHTLLGSVRSSDNMAHAQLLAQMAAEQGILTIGIGDGGNEIGFGAIAEAVRDIQPFGRKCACPCEGGVATVVTTDVLIAAAVSNWGAYGLAAMLATMLGKPEVLHNAETERRMLIDCVKAGAMDGVYARLIPAVDGTSADTQTSLITILHEIVRNASISYGRPF